MWSRNFIYLLIINTLFIFTKCDEHSKIYYVDKNFKLREEYNTNFMVDDDQCNTWVSRGYYKNEINNTGFAYLNIESNRICSDYWQALGVGVAEGILEAKIIYSQWYNTINFFKTTGNKSVITKVDEFLKSNTRWMNEQFEKYSKSNPYWYQLHLIYTQIIGIHVGYQRAQEHLQLPKLEFEDIFWLNAWPDLLDVYNALGGTEEVGDGHCSALVKILPGNKDIYFGHATWTTYQSMLKQLKKYTLYYRLLNSTNERIPATGTAFSSFPGSVASIDDYYLSSTGIAATETTNGIYNKKLWNNINPENMVWENFRALLATRLANSSENWVKVFKAYNSGTYNNQWMILDYKKFKIGQNPKAGAFWVAEQIPSKIVAKDLTNVLIEKGYWSSYNIPYFEEIYNESGTREQFKKYGDWFSYELTPRAKIFKRDHVKVKDMNSFMDLMRSNDYKKDPYAHCSCNPPYSASGAISSRKDLNPVNGTYQFKGQGHGAAGAIDAKITNSSLFSKLQFIAVAGPTTGTNNKLPVFKWSTSNFTKTPRMSHPDLWNFKPILHEWRQLPLF